MPTCSPKRRRPRQRGFTWLLLLFTLALGGAALARLGPQWQASLQHDLESELIFRGGEIAGALQAWRAVPPAPGAPACPATLRELLEDRRSGRVVHHLRRLYPDPFTGAPDWVLERQPDGGICGVHSRSRRRAFRRETLPAGVVVRVPPGTPATVGDWLFGEGAADQSAVTEPR